MADVLPVPDIPITPSVTLDPAHTALIVVDMQHDFVSDGGALQVPDARATVPVIADLVRRFRAAGARIVFTQDTHRDGDPEFAIWPPHALEGTHGYEIVDELHPLPDDTVLRSPATTRSTAPRSITCCASGRSRPSSSAAPSRTSACTTRPRPPR